MKKENIKTLIWLAVFSIAMGFLESSVVVYLRELYYPEGFNFPLQPIENNIAIVEILREAATLFMLIGVAYIASDRFALRFANFLYCFAIWDIFYYIFLKLILNWPESLLSWDILFLIPVTWVGPVIAPVIVSLIMIAFTFIIYKKQQSIAINEWILLISGSIVLIISFTYDYITFMLSRFELNEIFSINSDSLFSLSLEYIPLKFNWWIFIAALLLIIFGIVKYYFRKIKS